jgi:predicted ABC-type ATPase
MPQILVVAGPNGSGKTTLRSALGEVGTYVNADDIQSIRGESVLEAALEAEVLRESLLERRADFTFETVLSTPRNLDLLIRARAAGYRIESVFVLTCDPELNVQRVRARVIAGGHSVPVDKIRARYARSLANIPALVEVSDSFYLMDNTVEPAVIATRNPRDGDRILPNPFWDEAAIRRLLGGT